MFTLNGIIKQLNIFIAIYPDIGLRQFYTIISDSSVFTIGVSKWKEETKEGREEGEKSKGFFFTFPPKKLTST